MLFKCVLSFESKFKIKRKLESGNQLADKWTLKMHQRHLDVPPKNNRRLPIDIHVGSVCRHW